MRFLPTRVHAVLDLVVGIILILSPNIFGLQGGAISNIARILGVIVILDELVTDNGFSLLRIISMPMHLVSDLIVAAVLIVYPWLYLNGSDQSAHNWVPQLVIGLLIIGNTMITQTVPVRASAVVRARRQTRSRTTTRRRA